MDNGYEQEPIGQGRVRFTVRPAPLRRPRIAPAVLGCLAGLVVVVGSGGPAAAPLAVRLAIAALVGGWTAVRIRRALRAGRDRLRSPGGMFVTSRLGIDWAGSRIARADLGALSVRNPLLEPRRRGNAEAIAASYALCVGPRDRRTVIAGGMTESIALGLLEDVRRILGPDRPSTPTPPPRHAAPAHDLVARRS